MEELIERIKANLAEENTVLICQVDINEEEYKQLIEISKRKIDRLIRSWMQSTIVQADEVLAITLVQIAIRNYNNGDYWGTLDSEIGINIPQQKKNYIGEIFNKTLKDYNLFQIQCKDRNIYVENIKAHSFVPNNYMEGYLDFLFSFYNKNLLRQLTEETLSEDLQDMINFISGDIQNDDIIDISNTESHKTYRLLKATKKVISQCEESFVKSILSSHLSIIDSYYYGDRIGFESEERFSKSIQKWTETRFEINSTNGKRRSENTSYFGKPYFKILKQQSYLVIPPQKIRDSFNKGNLGKVIIDYDGNAIEEKLEYYKAYGIIISEEKRIPIEDLFCGYKIKIMGTTKTHDISSREYRCFDMNFNEVNQMRKGDYYVLVKKGKNIIGNRPWIYKNVEHRNWDEYRFNNINFQTVLYLDSKPITTNKGFEQSVTFDDYFNQCKVFKEDKAINVTQEHPTISFEIKKSAINGTFILCNSKKYNLVKDCKYEIENYNEDNVKIAVHLREILPKEDEFYHISVDKPGCAVKTICEYLLLNSFECDIKDRVFIFENRVTFHINSENTVKPLNFSEVDEGIYEIQLSENDTSIEFIMRLKGTEYKFFINIPVFKYGFEKQWKIEQPEVLLCKDLKNELWIMMPNATDGLLQLNDGYYKISGIRNNEIFKFDIINIINSIRNSSYLHNYIKFWYLDNEWKSVPLFTVLNKIHVSKLKLLREKNNVLIDIQAECSNQLLVEIIDLNSGNVADSFDFKNGLKNLPKLSPCVNYKINIYEKDELGFGFDELIETRDFPVDLKDLNNKTLLIEKIIMKINESQLSLNGVYRIKSISSRFHSHEGEMIADCALLAKRVKFNYFKEGDKRIIYDLQGFHHGQWLNLYYNKRTKTIIKKDSCKFDRNKQLHKDFIELNEAFKFIVTVKE